MKQEKESARPGYDMYPLYWTRKCHSKEGFIFCKTGRPGDGAFSCRMIEEFGNCFALGNFLLEIGQFSHLHWKNQARNVRMFMMF